MFLFAIESLGVAGPILAMVALDRLAFVVAVLLGCQGEANRVLCYWPGTYDDSELTVSVTDTEKSATLCMRIGETICGLLVWWTRHARDCVYSTRNGIGTEADQDALRGE